MSFSLGSILFFCIAVVFLPFFSQGVRHDSGPTLPALIGHGLITTLDSNGDSMLGLEDANDIYEKNEGLKHYFASKEIFVAAFTVFLNSVAEGRTHANQADLIVLLTARNNHEAAEAINTKKVITGLTDSNGDGKISFTEYMITVNCLGIGGYVSAGVTVAIFAEQGPGLFAEMSIDDYYNTFYKSEDLSIAQCVCQAHGSFYLHF